MDPGLFDVFEHRSDIQLVPVEHRVAVDLGRSFEEPVHEHGMGGRDIGRRAHVSLE